MTDTSYSPNTATAVGIGATSDGYLTMAQIWAAAIGPWLS
ncbi:hypothetical protein P3T27_006510 [Kitasatospora sp. MAA19]|nr:hypothetical protein [Kitasatospora sp. MAA19]